MKSIKKMIGDKTSGVEIERAGGTISLREYVEGHQTGEIVLNRDEVEEFIDKLRELIGDENVRK